MGREQIEPEVGDGVFGPYEVEDEVVPEGVVLDHKAFLETDDGVEVAAVGQNWTAACEHAEAFYNDETTRNLWLRGGVGSGKSTVAYQKAVKMGLAYPGLKTLITRTTGPMLKATSYEHFMSILPRQLIAREVLNPYPFIRLTNGSEYHFIPFNHEYIEKIGSLTLGLILAEESHLFRQGVNVYFDHRLRQKFGKAFDQYGNQYISNIPRQWVWYIGNPNGRDWQWKLFEREKDPNYRSFQCSTYCNKANLPPEFIIQLEKLPQHLRDRWVLGQCTENAGSVFPMFDRRTHVVHLKGWLPQRHWLVYFGMDTGFRSPTACLWMSVDEKGNVVVFREYYQSMRSAPQNGKAIQSMHLALRKLQMPEPVLWKIDPASHQHKGENEDGRTIYDQLVPWLPQLSFGSKDWNGRTSKINTMLEPDPDMQEHPVTKEFRKDGWPHLFITEDCPNLAQEMEEYQWKAVKDDLSPLKEEAEERNDHLIDSLGYALIEITQAASKSPEEMAAWLASEEYRLEKHKDEALKAFCKSGKTRYRNNLF